MEKATKFEKFFGSLPVTVGATALASSTFAAGNIFAPLLPVLTSTLAARRQQDRVVKAINEIEEVLKDHSEKIEKLSDHQFQLMNDMVNAICQNSNADKITLLRNSTINTVFEHDIGEHESVVLSRVLRDLSCWEFKFLVSIQEFESVRVMDEKFDKSNLSESIKAVQPGSNEDQIIRSLANYNLVKSDISGFGATLFYTITPVGDRLIKLCTVPN
ncbi:hypothetical protein [Vibrio cholerae]|uniref:hypothetical protein n=1 Tax=Vibrio cholerae TaxID=666 RepID=UPI0011D41E9D|nr:hypothetical protein [Vibrio cholerae]TXY78282.1 hypothetical protein FXE79_12920 [Vibrio cholerae]BCI77686.1 hypothetical protein VCSRO102_2945 [Vibrio cholerae]